MSQTNKRAYQPPRNAARAPGRPAGRPQAASTAYRQGARSMPARRRGRSSLPPGMAGLLAVGAVAIIVSLVLQMVWPNGFPLNPQKTAGTDSAQAAISEIYSTGPVRINEVMTGNLNTLRTEDGASADWIEIANISKSPIHLNGYSLSKSANAAYVFRFPDMTLEAGECVLVYADSRSRESADGELHAPFRLSSSGDTLMLFNARGTAIDTINIPALRKDTSYVRRDTSVWENTEQTTPGLLNTEENYQKLHEKVENSPVIVTELMASNTQTLADESGQYSDYIELYNRSNEAVSLKGWYLSDDPSNPRKWRFPDTGIEPGAYLIVFASGANRTEDAAHLHTSFSLSTEGEAAVLSNAHGQLMDLAQYDLLRDDVAWSLASDGSWVDSLAPSPGGANNG